MADPAPAPLTGRKAQAARNDEAILAAARAVFMDDPGAPIQAVAKRAGVGIAALYRRYPSKDDLLRKVCGDGLATYMELVQAALDHEGDVWEAFAGYVRGIVAADTPAITLRLAGTFAPTQELWDQSVAAGELNDRLFARTHAAGVLRDGVTMNDVALLTESLASLRLADEARTRELRLRYAELLLEAIRAPRDGWSPPPDLPSTPPTNDELGARWLT